MRCHCYRLVELWEQAGVDQEELLNKLGQIEEQANYTLVEYPRTLTKERLRMIIALARYLKTEVSRSPALPESAGDPAIAASGEGVVDSA